MLPAALVEDLYPESRRPGGRPRRTARDWIVDFTCFLLAVVIGLLAADTPPGRAGPLTGHGGRRPGGRRPGLAAVWLRRRWPVGLAVAMVPVSLVSATAGGAVLASPVHARRTPPLPVRGLDRRREPRPGPAVLLDAPGTRPAPTWRRSSSPCCSPSRSSAGACSSGPSASSCSASTTGPDARRRRRGCGPSRRNGWPGRPSPVRCTTSSRTRLTLLSVHAGALEFRPDAPRER